MLPPALRHAALSYTEGRRTYARTGVASAAALLRLPDTDEAYP